MIRPTLSIPGCLHARPWREEGCMRHRRILTCAVFPCSVYQQASSSDGVSLTAHSVQKASPRLSSWRSLEGGETVEKMGSPCPSTCVPKDQPWLSSLISLHLVLWVLVSHWTLSSPIHPGCLTNDLLESSLCIDYNAWLFPGCWGSKCRFSRLCG